MVQQGDWDDEEFQIVDEEIINGITWDQIDYYEYKSFDLAVKSTSYFEQYSWAPWCRIFKQWK